MEQSSELGKLIRQCVNELHSSAGWKSFIHARRGRTCLAPSVETLPHPASSLLNRYRQTGIEVELVTPNWTPERITQALARGSHPSARDYLGFLEADMADMIKKRYWIVLPYHEVQHLPDLRLLPFGVVPQHAWRPRPIVDYTYSGVNAETASTAPKEAMQFGRALDRLLYAIHTANPEKGPIYLAKLDQSDGFYRINVTSAMITGILRSATATLQHLNYHPEDVNARNLRSGGAMALLCGKVDHDVLQLVGRWNSNAMFRYLHAQALPLVGHLARTMLRHGAYSLVPGRELPLPAIQILDSPEGRRALEESNS